MSRYGSLWKKWDAAIDAGETPHDIMARISDESILQLLGSGGPDREYEKDVLTTEALNRMTETRRAVNRTTQRADTHLERVRKEADEAAIAVHALERVVEEGTRSSGSEPPTTETDVSHKASRHAERMRAALEGGDEARADLRRLRETSVARARHREMYEERAE